MPRLRQWPDKALLYLCPFLLIGLCVCPFVVAQPLIRAFTPADWALLKQQAELQPAAEATPLSAFFTPEHFFPALPLKPLLSADGQWVYYWRRQGLQYWLCRSTGNGEEQVLHKQREVPPPRLQLSTDQQQLWLAAADSLQVLDVRRKQVQSLWQPGFAIPGLRFVPLRHDAQVIRLGAGGAVLQWRQQKEQSFWWLRPGVQSQQIWPELTPQHELWRDQHGTVVVQSALDTPEYPPAAPDALLSNAFPAEALQVEISARLRTTAGVQVATARLFERLYWQGATEAWQALLDQIQALAPACSMQLQLSDNQRKMLVSFACSDQPNAQFWLLSVDANLQLVRQQALQLDARTELPGAPGAFPLQVAWQAADQQVIPAHLYLPRGRPLAQSPLLVLLHGGPFQRTDPGYDVLVQWLVRQGMIVLQPDYRSSSGFGAAFRRAARGEFGQKNPALTDIFSGLDLLLQAGIGDPTQLAIIGQSFGGYLTLQAMQAQPLRFRFGLAYTAPVDLAATFSDYVPRASVDIGQPALGAELYDNAVPWAAPEWQQRMHAEAPLKQLHLLQRPLFLWGGQLDDRITPQSLQTFLQQAQDLQKPVRLWLDPDSGHQATSLQSRRLQFYLAASLSLSHLKAAAPLRPHRPPPPAAATAADVDLEAIDSALQALEVRPVSAGN